nr:hypothetical protein [Kribbella soli]
MNRCRSLGVERDKRCDDPRQLVVADRIEPGQAADLTEPVVDGVRVNVQVGRGLSPVARVPEVAPQRRHQVVAVRHHGAQYVDLRTPSIGHDACAPITQRWLEGLIPTSAAAPLHPSARGMQAFGELVAAAAH